ncbi:exonuclease [Alcaligenes phage vB_Af_QDWS535]|nr:exonuclease [Alcaligenes phage vB_Af_QDWS535]
MSQIELAGFDSDVIVYRVGFSCQVQGTVVEPEQVALARVDELVRLTMENTGATEMVHYLTGDNNYRLEYNPEYKANRDPTAKPVYYSLIKEYLLDEYGAHICQGHEADDALGIMQCTSPKTTVICTIDKDLDMIPGWHYNFAKHELGLNFVDEFEGLKWFYQQFLIGDNVDNIIGVRGWGPVKSRKLFDSCETEYEMFERVREIYDNDERLLMNGRCLWIQREPNQIWEFPEPTINNNNEEDELDGTSPSSITFRPFG